MLYFKIAILIFLAGQFVKSKNSTFNLADIFNLANRSMLGFSLRGNIHNQVIIRLILKLIFSFWQRSCGIIHRTKSERFVFVLLMVLKFINDFLPAKRKEMLEILDQLVMQIDTVLSWKHNKHTSAVKEILTKVVFRPLCQCFKVFCCVFYSNQRMIG